jgi:hypothetical protein
MCRTASPTELQSTANILEHIFICRPPLSGMSELFSSSKLEVEFPMKDDGTSKSERTDVSDLEMPSTAGAEKPAPAELEGEWTVASSLQVLGGFMILFNTYVFLFEGRLICRWGYVNAFGVFQNYYKTVLVPDSSNSQISWIGSTQGISL